MGGCIDIDQIKVEGNVYVGEIKVGLDPHYGDATIKGDFEVEGDAFGVDHSKLENTHNLTTDIDHDQLSGFEILEHINHGIGLTTDFTVGDIRLDFNHGLLVKFRKMVPVPPIEEYTTKYKVLNENDRRLRDVVLEDDVIVSIGWITDRQYTGLFRWQINIPKGSMISDATIAYYVGAAGDTLPNTRYAMFDSTNMGPFEINDPASQFASLKDEKCSGYYPGTMGWKKRNITSWLKWFIENPHYDSGKWFGVKFVDGENVPATNDVYWITDRFAGDGNEVYIWIKYEL